MKKSEGNQPFYRNRNWLLGFVVSLAAVFLIYYLETRPSRMRNAAEPVQATPTPAAQGNLLPATLQPAAGWEEGISFTAPGPLPSDLLRVGEEMWIFTEEGKKLVRVNLKGEMLAETPWKRFAARQPGMVRRCGASIWAQRFRSSIQKRAKCWRDLKPVPKESSRLPGMEKACG